MVDLKRATERDQYFLTGFCVDTGLALMKAGDEYAENDFLAKNLAGQLDSRGIKLKTPKIIYFDALDLREDNNSGYGLIYILNERAELGKNIIDAPELVSSFKFKIINEETGIPIEYKLGKRAFCTRWNGLSRFCLYWGSTVGSYDMSLAKSYNDYNNMNKTIPYGRVIVVSEV